MKNVILEKALLMSLCRKRKPLPCSFNPSNQNPHLPPTESYTWWLRLDLHLNKKRKANKNLQWPKRHAWKLSLLLTWSITKPSTVQIVICLSSLAYANLLSLFQSPHRIRLLLFFPFESAEALRSNDVMSLQCTYCSSISTGIIY
jgi:hypothetical protein